MSVEVQTPAAPAAPPAPEQPPEPEKRVLVKLVGANRYMLRNVLYERGKTYEVSPALRDYMVGMDTGYVDAVGRPLVQFVDVIPGQPPIDDSIRHFTPMTKEGHAMLSERPKRDDGFRVAQPVDMGGEIDTAMGRTGRRARDPAQAQRLLKKVPV